MFDFNKGYRTIKYTHDTWVVFIYYFTGEKYLINLKPDKKPWVIIIFSWVIFIIGLRHITAFIIDFPTNIDISIAKWT